MNSQSKYKTRQRDLLISYFENKPDGHVTARDVYNYFLESGVSIGQATIYRQLERFVDEGLVKKYIIDENTPACFEYAGESVSCNHEICFHCKCEKCGTLIHLHCEELEEIRDHMLKEHKFKLNTARTVFYGLCENCAGI